MTGVAERGESRRAFLAGAGAACVAVPGLAQTAAARKRRRRPTVAVFGGGVAGLTAAHELVLRGFAVTVYERRVWGGKCFSSTVAGSGVGGRRPLPGEHAYRVPFGFYQNLPDTMRRIPSGSGPNGVFDHLVAAPQLSFARTAKSDLVLPMGQADPGAYSPRQFIELVRSVAIELQMPPDAAAYLSRRLAVFLSSCDARRAGQWEETTWLDFIGADRFGEDYRKTLGALPEFTQASRAETTSAKYIGTLLELAIHGLVGRGVNGPVIRVLDGPTQDVWIRPWVAELRRLGVRLERRRELVGWSMRHGRIAGARVRHDGRVRSVVADYYVCALPVERARRLWSPGILRAAPELRGMSQLEVAWMNGISYYLRERPDIVRGHVLLGDSPWSGSFVCQAQFWPGDFAATYGDGTVRDKLSAAITNWDAPGTVYERPARELAPDDVARELWEQIKQHVNEPGERPRLTDSMLHSWQIDPLMHRRARRLVSADPLVLPTAGTEKHRPPVQTAIPNLVLCGDYLSRDWIITTMESANHTGRQAANALLGEARPREDPVPVVAPYQPEEWAGLRAADERRWAAGQPNLFD